jgi:hypothetical protein
LVPRFDSYEVSAIDNLEKWFSDLLSLRHHIIQSPFSINPDWNTPLYPKSLGEIYSRDDLVVIYPETTFGNPLRARNVARWILCKPGFHSRTVYFSPGEVHFQFLEMHPAIPMPWIEISNLLLSVHHIPWEFYQPPPEGSPRTGSAFIMRKGANKRIIHDRVNSICVDGMSHAEIGAVCRKVKSFISYDSMTTYSSLAVVAGADSIIIPDPGISIEQWQPDPAMRVGLAYGFEGLENARQERTLLIERLSTIESNSRPSVERFIDFWHHRLISERIA